MKRIIAPLFVAPLLLAFISQQPKTTVKSYSVKLRITQTSNYCGGVAPSQEMIQEYNTPKPFANKIFYIRPGSKNSLNFKNMLKVKTDSMGIIRTKLKPGNYVLLFPSMVNKPEFPKAIPNSQYEFQGMDCLNAWWNKGWQLITVGNKSTELTFNLHFPCFADPINGPCMEYRGPYPP